MPFQGIPAIMTAGFRGSAAPPGVSMGFDFRSTSGFVTDPTNFTYVLKTDTYPTLRGGLTFGWVLDNNAVFDADRDNTNDPRLAGINFTAGYGGVPILSNSYFRADLLATGTYNIFLAVGDATAAQTNQRVEIRDNTTDLSFVVGPANTSANHFLDANAVDLTNVTWPSSQTSKSAVFATTILRMYAGDLTASDVTTVASLQITQ